MEMVCPACNKVNMQAAHCSRCGADLQPLAQIRRSAALALNTGTQYLKQNDGRNALRQAELSWHLKQTADAARLAFLACLLLQHFTSATRWYKRAVARSE